MRRPKPLPPGLTAGAFTRSHLANEHVAAGRLRRGDTVSPFNGVHTLEARPGALGRCHDYAPRLRPGQLFSHVTAAQVHNLPLPPALERRRAVDVAAVHPAAPPETKQVIGHRLRREPETVQVEGLAFCSAEEVWCQLAAVLDLVELVVIADHLLHHAAADAGEFGDDEQELAAAAARERLRAAIAVPGRWRRAILSRALALARWRSASPGESRVRVLLVLAAVPEPELNRVVVDDGTWLGSPDLLWRAERVTVEYEGDGHRVSKERFRHDIDRYDAFQAAGWTVIRVTADNLLPERRAALVSRVKDALGVS